VPASGVVTFDGNPIEGANVIFYPSESDQTLASQSVTDQDGRFELKTHVGGGKMQPGIAPGRYAVAITKFDTGSIATTLSPPKDVLPRKYGGPKTSGLTANVEVGSENNFQFALTSK
jgi:hypothetical protein